MKKVYAVKKGKKTGIFYNWDEVKELISGFSGAEYKGFKTLKEAEGYLNGEEAEQLSFESGNLLIAYIDGSFDSETMKYSFGIVLIKDGKVIKTLSQVGESEEAASMRNVAGELSGAMTAIRYAALNGYEKIRIYHDYEGIGKWARGEWKTNLNCTASYKAYCEKMSKKIELEFIKVPAHSGVEYNEMADKLAKEALGK
ncbi:MAG: reverse transcriptase-like protein [Ruminococcaceae bacterium]|nr:reverse transcriptase-like protein [Oscillospiraceae bacterium]